MNVYYEIRRNEDPDIPDAVAYSTKPVLEINDETQIISDALASIGCYELLDCFNELLPDVNETEIVNTLKEHGYTPIPHEFT